MKTWLWNRGLLLANLALFFLFFVGMAVFGFSVYHGAPPVTVWEYLGTSQFWFESMQNWQSEFLAIAVMVGASVYLRYRGSAESKPVAASHSTTGA